MSGITIRIQNFRALTQFIWSPEEVCLLSGANGSGKTTTLDALRFLQSVFMHGHEAAFQRVSGRYFKRQEAPVEDPVEFEIEVDKLRWKLRFPMSPTGLKGTFGEELHHDGQVKLRVGMFDDSWFLGKERLDLDQTRCCARVLWDRGSAPWMQPLVDALRGLRVYDSYWLDQVKRSQPVDSHDSYLHGTGKNLWSVLSTWQGSPTRYQGRFQWVLERAREAFPGQISSIEFDRGLPYLFRPGATDPADGLPPERAADGLLTGLLHLTAVAGAQAGAIVAFDEMENHLHPHAIRRILAAFRDLADETNLTVIVTSHSPVVMNTFKGEEDQFFVLERQNGGPVPQALSELHDSDWLVHYALGDLYDREEFASPRDGTN